MFRIEKLQSVSPAGDSQGVLSEKDVVDFPGGYRSGIPF